MLKKLVKYGNSNALVLDKTILALLDLEEGSLVKMTIQGNQLMITAAKDVDVKDKFKLDILSTFDSKSEDEKDQGWALLNKTLQEISFGDLTLDQYEKQKSDFEEYFQKEEVASTMNEITNNPKVREISEALMKQYNEKKIDLNDYRKLYHEEIKKIDYDLYLKIKAMNAGIANVSKKS
jgi:antitoxin component of MazEF toxin-antitoxin module